MAEPIARPGGHGGSVYPQTASTNMDLPKLPERASPSSTTINQTAHSVGEAVGAAVGRIRNVPQRLRVVGGRATTARSISDVQEQASEKLSELSEAAQDNWREAQRNAREVIGDARRRAAYVVDEYPLQTIVGSAAMAFVVGIVLRIWRSNSD